MPGSKEKLQVLEVLLGGCLVWPTMGDRVWGRPVVRSVESSR